MKKAYLVTQYHEVRDADKLAAYAALALPAMQAAGGTFIIRGMPTQAYEAGQINRTVVIEFPSLAAAEAAYHTDAYQEALAALGDGATRDMRVIEGV